MRKKTQLASVCLAVVLIGIGIYGVMNHFRSDIYISDDDTPLVDFVLDYYDENMEQIEAERVLNEIVIKFVDPANILPNEEKQYLREIAKVQKIGFVEALGFYVVKVDDLERNPNAVLNRFKNNRFIEYIEPNYTLGFSLVPNDTNYNSQLASLNLIQAQTGWDISTGKNENEVVVTVAIVDSGVALHNDLPEQRNGYASVANQSYNNDTVGHGTGVAGVVGAKGNNNYGIAGINWNANIVSAKVDDASGSVSVANVAKAIIWAADNGAKVLNMSLGLLSDSLILKNAIDYAYDKGCALIAASGNIGTNTVLYPAKYDNVLAVGAVNAAGTARESWSNYGKDLDVVAPGTVYTTSKTGGFSSVSGTSFSSPLTAGLASLIYATNPNLTNEEVYSLIRQGAKPLGGGYNEQTGYGLIDVRKTLELASVGAPPITTQDDACTTSPVITLNGFMELKLTAGDSYEETGYTAFDCHEKDITGNVDVVGSINMSIPDIYVLSYNVTDDYGNTAKATRLITVESEQEELVPPTIKIVGSDTILLHLNSGTPYVEQGAKATDSDGKDISKNVEIIGEPDRYNEGVYQILYRVTGKNGIVATTTRNVLIIAPNSAVAVRTPYNFARQTRRGDTDIFPNIVSEASGWMDLKVTSIDKTTAITVQLVDTINKKVVLKQNIASIGSKQFNIGAGTYELSVYMDKSPGTSKYSIELLMPEVVTMEFDEVEIPLVEFTEDNNSINKLALVVAVLLCLGFTYLIIIGVRKSRKAKAAK